MGCLQPRVALVVAVCRNRCRRRCRCRNRRVNVLNSAQRLYSLGCLCMARRVLDWICVECPRQPVEIICFFGHISLANARHCGAMDLRVFTVVLFANRVESAFPYNACMLTSTLDEMSGIIETILVKKTILFGLFMFVVLFWA